MLTCRRLLCCVLDMLRLLKFLRLFLGRSCCSVCFLILLGLSRFDKVVHVVFGGLGSSQLVELDATCFCAVFGWLCMFWIVFELLRWFWILSGCVRVPVALRCQCCFLSFWIFL